MPDYKGILKKGWHPEKDGTSLKGQVKGVFKRDKSPPRREASRTITSLRDPSSFAPPPKRIGTSGSVVASPPPPPGYSSVSNRPVAFPESDPEPQHHDAREKASAPRPHWMNTTGLSTSHLPPPPVRGAAKVGAAAGTAARPPPPLPPSTNTSRCPPPALPPRILPQNAGAASLSTKSAPSPPPTAASSPSPASEISPPSQVSQLQSRFKKLSPSLTDSSKTSSTPPEGTTWAQKQAALRTASQFRKDPGSVSLSDARAAASTANNFHQRHREQLASGLQVAGKLDDKYGVSNKAGHYVGLSANAASIPQAEEATRGGSGSGSSGNLAAATGILGKKKPPPPPPPKRRGISESTDVEGNTPPPVPISTRPAF